MKFKVWAGNMFCGTLEVVTGTIISTVQNISDKTFTSHTFLHVSGDEYRSIGPSEAIQNYKNLRLERLS